MIPAFVYVGSCMMSVVQNLPDDAVKAVKASALYIAIVTSKHQMLFMVALIDVAVSIFGSFA